jgi:hypothetical protein
MRFYVLPFICIEKEKNIRYFYFLKETKIWSIISILFSFF